MASDVIEVKAIEIIKILGSRNPSVKIEFLNRDDHYVLILDSKSYDKLDSEKKQTLLNDISNVLLAFNQSGVNTRFEFSLS